MTARPFSVRSAPDDEHLAAATIASLPVSFARAAEAPADVVEVAGGPVWVDDARRAIDAGAAGVIVTQPGAVAASAVRALAESSRALGTPVVLEEPFAGDPAIAAAMEVIAPAVAAAVLVLVQVTLPEASDADLVLTGIRATRALGMLDLRVDTVTRTHRSIAVNGSLGRGSGDRAVLALTATRTHAVAPRVQLQAWSAVGGVEIDLPDSRTARPAGIVVTDRAGSRVLPAVFESSRRAGWRRLADTIDAHSGSGSGSGSDLDTFADDLDLVGRL